MHISFETPAKWRDHENAATARAKAAAVKLPCGAGRELTILTETYVRLVIPVGQREAIEGHIEDGPFSVSVAAVWGEKEGEGPDAPVVWKTIVPLRIYNKDDKSLNVQLPEHWKGRTEPLNWRLSQPVDNTTLVFVYLFRENEHGGPDVDLVAIESPTDDGRWARIDLWPVEVTGSQLMPTRLLNGWDRNGFPHKGAWVEAISFAQRRVFGTLHYGDVDGNGKEVRLMRKSGGSAARTANSMKELIG